MKILGYYTLLGIALTIIGAVSSEGKVTDRAIGVMLLLPMAVYVIVTLGGI